MQKSHFLTYTLLLMASVVLTNTAAKAEPLNLGKLRHKVEVYHDSGDYERELQAVTQQAMQFINQKVTANQQSKHPQKLAVVLDIDETSLSNYAKMQKRGFVATKAQLLKEDLEANAPAIKPTLSLYRDALQHKVAIFFVTGRREMERQATILNLKKAGFNQWQGLYFKPSDYHKESAIPFKSHARELITRKGYRIIASIGDQCSDFKGGYTEAGFKLPNPYYHLP